MSQTVDKHRFVLLVVVAFTIRTNGQDSRYLGCFFDNVNDRALPGLTFCPDFTPFCNYCSSEYPYCQSATNMSVTNCVYICSRLNFVFAGVQAEAQCFCGERSAMYARNGRALNEDMCKSNCRGDPTQSCGTALRMEIYEIGCLPFDTPPNATLSFLTREFFEVGQSLKISCQASFFLSGPGELTCLPIGEWNHPPPSCLPDVCAPSDLPPGVTLRGNSSQINGEFRGGDKLEFDCDDTNVILNLTCSEGRWHVDGRCQEMFSTEMQPTLAPTREIQATEMEPTDGQATKIYLTAFQATVVQSTEIQTLQMTVPVTSPATDIFKTQTSNEEITVKNGQTVLQTNGVTQTPWQGSMTTMTKYARSGPTIMLWLLIVIAVAGASLIVVVSLAVILGCKKKTKRDRPINFHGETQTPKVEDMSQLNYAYEVDGAERPNQNGRQATGSQNGSPIRISTLYSQQEITVQNNNDSQYTYARPVSAAYPTSQSGTTPNEYASPVHMAQHVSTEGAANGEARTTPSLYLSDIPEPDYDIATRGSYVELVTKL